MDKFLNAPLPERDVAAWNWYSHEKFYMDETDPGFCDDFSQISSYPYLPEARSIAFWEANVIQKFLYGQEPIDLLGGLVKLPKVPIEIVHGKGDLLCPMVYAELLENSLKSNGYSVTAHYIDSGHRVTNNPILEGVRAAVERFAKNYFAENNL